MILTFNKQYNFTEGLYPVILGLIPCYITFSLERNPLLIIDMKSDGLWKMGRFHSLCLEFLAFETKMRYASHDLG